MSRRALAQQYKTAPETPARRGQGAAKRSSLEGSRVPHRQSRSVLHVGCGQNRLDRLPRPFQNGSWRETRLDLNPDVDPDFICSITDMAPVPSDSMDAVFSSHNIEHLFAHEVGDALCEFARVLKSNGLAIITCPDVQSVAAVIAEGRLEEPVYSAPAGPISPVDILYGHRRSIAAGNTFMAHRTGFTLKSLAAAISRAGFGAYAGLRRPKTFDLWMVASKGKVSDDALKKILVDCVTP
ncbi:MAG: methyltransferase domain-containing protein [Pseudomonadota bacterium]